MNTMLRSSNAALDTTVGPSCEGEKLKIVKRKSKSKSKKVQIQVQESPKTKKSKSKSKKVQRLKSKVLESKDLDFGW